MTAVALYPASQVAMTHLGYLISGWGISLVVISLYALSLIRRGRVVSGRVPAERRRWMSNGD